jgi:hypothetical protein
MILLQLAHFLSFSQVCQLSNFCNHYFWANAKNVRRRSFHVVQDEHHW